MIDDNVVVLDGKIPYESYHMLDFTSHAMLLEGKLTPARFPSWCNVFDDNVVVLDGNYLMKANTHYLLLTVQCFKNEN